MPIANGYGVFNFMAVISLDSFGSSFAQMTDIVQSLIHFNDEIPNKL